MKKTKELQGVCAECGKPSIVYDIAESYCDHCGASNYDDDAMVCEECGALLGDVQVCEECFAGDED